MQGRRIDVIFNVQSGSQDKQDGVATVRERLLAAGARPRIELARTSEELLAASARAREGDADLIVAAGGDGTVTAAASAVIDTPKTLGVLPLGTYNYFAKRRGIPLEIGAALDVLVTGEPRLTSVADVNGRIFLNNSSIGLYPNLLKEREQAYLRIGRNQMTSYLSAALVLVQPQTVLNLQMVADGVPLARRTPLLFVCANPEQLALTGVPGGGCLENGRLAACMMRPLAPPHLWRLAVRALFRGLHGARELEVVCARELVVTVRRPRVRVAMDGEIVRLAVPLRYQLRPDALRVQHPRQMLPDG
jgi:diacylglycerol kinase family enzyme